MDSAGARVHEVVESFSAHGQVFTMNII